MSRMSTDSTLGRPSPSEQPPSEAAFAEDVAGDDAGGVAADVLEAAAAAEPEAQGGRGQRGAADLARDGEGGSGQDARGEALQGATARVLRPAAQRAALGRDVLADVGTRRRRGGPLAAGLRL